MRSDMGNPDQDRRMAMEDDIEDRSMGFKADDGGNMSVDEKDDFWKTQEGYNKAMEMYGTKPSFVPDEPTLVFNPVTQGQKFDPDGTYTRRFVPELQDMPNKFLFNPWDAPKDVLKRAGVQLGQNYPQPIVEVKASRQRALDAFADLPKSKI